MNEITRPQHRERVLTAVLEREYGLTVQELQPLPEQGLLGDVWTLNHTLVVKRPRLGGGAWQPEGNVLFSSLLMNALHSAGLPVPEVHPNLHGQYVTVVPNWGSVQVMTRLSAPPDAPSLPPRELAQLLGGHAAHIARAGTAWFRRQDLPAPLSQDPWSVDSIHTQLLHIFQLEEGSSASSQRHKLFQLAERLKHHPLAPSELTEELEDAGPLHALEECRRLARHPQRSAPDAVVHNDLKPGNVFIQSQPQPSIVGSYDYTMASWCSLVRNVSSTYIDSGWFTEDRKGGTFDLLERLAAGHQQQLPLTAHHMQALAVDLHTVALKKYMLRWNYWKGVLAGTTAGTHLAQICTLKPLEFLKPVRETTLAMDAQHCLHDALLTS